MKQYTTPEQTAKLIELGFEKPMNTTVREEPIYREGSIIDWKPIAEDGAYSIGELLSFLPESVNWTPRIIRGNVIEYSFETEGSELYYCNAHNELIDNLFDMVIKLKEEGVI